MKFTAGILNAYDHRNRGDRAIIEAQMAWIARKMPGADFRIFSAAWKENTTAFGSHRSKRHPIRMAEEGGGWRSLAENLRPVCESLATAATGWRKDGGSDFEECDAYFLCGGGYFYSSTAPFLSRQLWIHAGNSLLALKSGKPVLQFPQSWGPVTKSLDGWICRKVAQDLRCITSRGLFSTALLKKWGYDEKVLEVPDVVLAMRHLRPDLVGSNPVGDGTLGISPIDFRFARKRSRRDLDLYLGRLEEVAAEFRAQGGKGVILFPQVVVPGSDEDLSVAEDVARRLDRRGISNQVLRNPGWEEYWQAIARPSAFLGSRMHACIFSMVSGVPTIGLAYQPKFHALFRQLGFESRCFDIEDFDPRAVGRLLAQWGSDTKESRKEVLHAVAAVSRTVLSSLDRCWDLCGVSGKPPLTKTASSGMMRDLVV